MNVEMPAKKTVLEKEMQDRATIVKVIKWFFIVSFAPILTLAFLIIIMVAMAMCSFFVLVIIGVIL